jgi:hypothetical protein
MTLVLDAGALIAIDRNNKDIVALIKRERLAGREPLTHGAIVGQVWRNGARQANLARALEGIRVEPLDQALGRRAGLLLRASATSDVVDAALVLLACDGDEIITSDAGDIAILAEAADLFADVLIV